METEFARTESREHGSSLVELLMLLGAAAILILGSVTAVVQHAAQRRVHGEQILAMTTCRNVLEQLRSLPIAELPALNGAGFDVPGPDGQPGGLLCVPGDSDGLPGTIEIAADRSSGTVGCTTSVRWCAGKAPPATARSRWTR